MNWDKCIICQKDTKKPVQCPANSKRKNVGTVYSSFKTNLKAYLDLGIVPALANILFLDDSKEIEQTLTDNKAVWHKSCWDLFSNTKVEQAKKRKLNDIQNEADEDNNITETTRDNFSPIKPRCSPTESSLQSEVHCFFFCEKPDSVTNLC